MDNVNAKKPISLLCLTTTVGPAGSETMLYKLLSRIDRKQFAVGVVSLIDLGPTIISKKISDLGVPIRYLGMKRGKPSLAALLQLIRWLREDPPDLIQTWMYHSDLLGGIAARFAGNIPILWGVRHSNLDSKLSGRLTVYTAKACALLSHWLPDRILCCSESGRQIHVQLGYAPGKMIVVPNGFDLEAYKPDAKARASVREELEIWQDAPIIGLVARFDPQKDHRTFFEAAKILARNRPDVHFVLCGSYDVTWDAPDLVKLIEEAGVRARVRLLGRREDMPRLTAAFDIAVLPSAFGEGFPNVIGEAMSCEVPCVVTDVGDSAFIVGETGRVVPPRNPQALAGALRDLIELPAEVRKLLGSQARRRIQEHFDLATVVARYQALFRDLVHRGNYGESSYSARLTGSGRISA